MRGHNVNIYFSEENYNKIKPLIAQRRVSEFVNQAVEKELSKQQKKAQAELKEKLIADYQSIAESKKAQKEAEIWDETINDAWNAKHFRRPNTKYSHRTKKDE